MKKTSSILLWNAIFLTCFYGCTVERSEKFDQEIKLMVETSVREVIDAHNLYWQGDALNNLDNIVSLRTDDCVSIMEGHSSSKNEMQKGILDWLNKTKKNKTKISYEYKDITVKPLSHNLAYANVEYKTIMTDSVNNSRNFIAIHTMIFKKENNNWKIILEHESFNKDAGD